MQNNTNQKQDTTQINLNKANALINKALHSNPISTNSLNFAIGHLCVALDSLSENFKEKEIIIPITENKVLGDTFEEHY